MEAMEPRSPVQLAASEIHGFRTTADLDIGKLLDDASKRWLRPNEIYAVLSNYTLLKIQPQPVMNPGSGSLLLFDRNMLRNFRKDGHNWRKKKDGKTVQEAHEKLKIGTDERIHVYYARGEDYPNFYRRCYWLLERSLERIVLVHYRQTSEDNANQQLSAGVEFKEKNSLANSLHASPLTPLDSTSGSNHIETSGSLVFSDEINSTKDCATITELENPDLAIDMINKFDWASLVEPQPSGDPNALPYYGDTLFFVEDQSWRSLGHVQPTSMSTFTGLNAVGQPVGGCLQPAEVDQETVHMHAIPDTCANEALQSQNSFTQWDYVVDDIPGSLNNTEPGCQTSDDHEFKKLSIENELYRSEEVFSITDISPAWSYADEETKVIVVGYFRESHKNLANSKMFVVFGDAYVPAEMIQLGVYRCRVLPHTRPPGLINFYLTLDKQTPVSQVMNFEVRPPTSASTKAISLQDADDSEPSQRDLDAVIRLVRLLFSSSNNLSILSNVVSSNALKGAKRFLSATSSSLEKDWMHLLKLVRKNDTPLLSINQQLFELVLKNKLQEWLSTKLAEGRRTTELDNQGLGVIHLCAILDYTWAAHLFKASGLSIDFRDVYGWTALHWAAYCGRVKMVAALLSSGANPSLVTDPTPQFPGGCTAADLASNEGYEGLGAYLAEKALSAHFEAMNLSGNVSNPSARASSETANLEIMESGSSEQEVLLKYSLAAYCNAADAADRIHGALRDRTLRLHVKAAELSNSEANAAYIISALKIQKAYRNHNGRKMMKAAARIQGTFRTWQARKNFLNMRRHTIRIQAAFRGLLVRRQYRQIIWSVGVLEKAVLRWRLKRKGLRGLQIEADEVPAAAGEEMNVIEEDFFRASREQAEERVNRSVVRVQAMFRSHRAQQEYRKMKLAHDQAQLEYDEFANYGESGQAPVCSSSPLILL
ncbi:unnamed protein product [Spirodela intermedia]|uniref:CG-1 domain-containing protein n=1 Tax=Spirodela intermedia TaxID=51605 RepID=A0A7I8KS82_SPIIN|nr:unnamed protein product [Spirodela intermedia]